MDDFSSFFPKMLAVFVYFSKWRVPNMQQNSEKSSNIATIWGKWRKLCKFYHYYLNCHSWNQKRSQCSVPSLKLHFLKDFSLLFPAVHIYESGTYPKLGCFGYLPNGFRVLTRISGILPDPSLTNTTVDITREHYRNTMIEELI